MKVEPLYDCRRGDRIAAGLLAKERQVAGGFLAADSFDGTFKRKVDGNTFQPAQRRWAPIQSNAWQLANSDLRILQRRSLRIQTQVQTVRVIILVEENLGTFLWRNRLLDRIGNHLAKREARSDVHVSRRQKTVGKIVHGINVETRTALIRILRAGLWPKNAILNKIKTQIEKRARVGARPEIGANPKAALGKEISAHREVGRTAERQIVAFGKANAFSARDAERRRQETRRTIAMLERQRSVRQIDDRDLLNPESRRDQAHAIAGLDPRALRAKAPLRLFFIARGHLAIDDDDRVKADLLDSIGGEVHPRAVLTLIGVAGRVDEETGLRLVIPFPAAARDALVITLIANHVAFGDDFVGRFVNSDLVGLQAVRADARVDVALINFDDRALRPSRSLLVGSDVTRVARMYGRRLRAGRAHRLILLKGIDVRRVGDWVGDLAFYRTAFLGPRRARPRASKDDRNPEKDWQN